MAAQDMLSELQVGSDTHNESSEGEIYQRQINRHILTPMEGKNDNENSPTRLSSEPKDVLSAEAAAFLKFTGVPNMNRMSIYIPDHPEIYQHHLSVKKRGFPLWMTYVDPGRPLPNRERGICIGDLGTITSITSFDSRFNVFLPRNDPSQIRPPPEDFEPLPPLNTVADVHEVMQLAPGSYLASDQIYKVGEDSASSASLCFETSCVEGAVLALPEGQISLDIVDIQHIRTYVAANIQHWYHYYIVTKTNDLENGNLRLVIGCDKAPSCGVVVLKNKQQNNHMLRFFPDEQPLLIPTPTEETYPSYSWEYTGCAEMRINPDPTTFHDLHARTGEKHWNQATFIRTLTFTLNDQVFESITDEAVANRVKQLREHVERVNKKAMATGDEDYMVTEEEMGIRTDASGKEWVDWSNIRIIAPSPPVVHPSNAINKELLRRVPHAHLAITQDEDWYSILTDDDTVMPLMDVLVDRVFNSYNIKEENGTVYLEPTPIHLRRIQRSTSSLASADDSSSETAGQPSIHSSGGDTSITLFVTLLLFAIIVTAVIICMVFSDADSKGLPLEYVRNLFDL